MLADQFYAWPLGRPNFTQLPQERTSPELIEFVAKRLIHRDSLPAPRIICHRDRAGFPGSARVSRVGDDVSVQRVLDTRDALDQSQRPQESNEAASVQTPDLVSPRTTTMTSRPGREPLAIRQ